MRRKNKLLVMAVAAGISLAGGRAAMASWTISDLSQNQTTGEYQYQVLLSAATTSATVSNGDGFAIFDFPDLVTNGQNAWSLTGMPSGLTSNLVLSQQNSGNAINPLFDGIVTDDPNIPNLSFQYDNSTPFVVPSNTEYTGTLTLYTTDTGPGVTLNSNGWAIGEDQVTGNQYFDGNVTVPVPEPMTLGMLALGGSALLCGRAGRRRRVS